MKNLKGFLFILLLYSCSAALTFSQVSGESMNEKRAQLIDYLKENQGIRDRKLLYSIELIDREYFIPERFRKYTYTETAVPLSNGKKIPPVSDIVKALNMFDTREKEKVLIIGNNAGYAAALFSYFYDNVYLIETDTTKEDLYDTLLEDKYNNINIFYGSAADAFQGYGPFDAIFIHGSVQQVSPTFFDILKSLGEIIFPLESKGGLQQIVKYKKVYSEISISAGDISNFPPLR